MCVCVCVWVCVCVRVCTFFLHFLLHFSCTQCVQCQIYVTKRAGDFVRQNIPRCELVRSGFVPFLEIHTPALIQVPKRVCVLIMRPICLFHTFCESKLAWGLPIYTTLYDLDLVSRSPLSPEAKQQIVIILRFLTHMLKL